VGIGEVLTDATLTARQGCCRLPGPWSSCLYQARMQPWTARQGRCRRRWRAPASPSAAYGAVEGDRDELSSKGLLGQHRRSGWRGRAGEFRAGWERGIADSCFSLNQGQIRHCNWHLLLLFFYSYKNRLIHFVLIAHIDSSELEQAIGWLQADSLRWLSHIHPRDLLARRPRYRKLDRIPLRDLHPS